jgi:hypothetical protein
MAHRHRRRTPVRGGAARAERGASSARAERAAMTLSALVPETFARDEDARVFAGAALAA